MVLFRNLLVMAMLLLQCVNSSGESVNTITIYVYEDTGVDRASYEGAVSVFGRLSPRYNIIKGINAEYIRKGHWVEDADVLIMPGGEAASYVERLGDQGNDIIRKYVATGGAFLGIGAGAYYAASAMQIDGHNPVAGVKLLETKATGPLLGYENGPHLVGIYSNFGRDAELANNPINRFSMRKIEMFYFGGPYFELAPNDMSKISTVGWYALSSGDDLVFLPALVHVRYGDGSVVLSGVNFEQNPDDMDTNDKKLVPIIEELRAHDWSTAMVYFAGDVLELLLPKQ